MPSPVETEIKLQASEGAMEALRDHPLLAGPETTSTLLSTYFDTLGRRLERSGASLRIRDNGVAREQTLKLLGPGIRRGEWTVDAAGDRPQPSAFPATASRALKRATKGADLHAVASTRIDRTTRRLTVGVSVIEAAFDHGEAIAGDRREAIRELELELVEGRLADVIELALGLPLGPELGWSVRSKAARCYAIAFDLPPRPIRAEPLRVATGITVAEGFRAIAWSCLEHLLANYRQVIEAGEPEALHQSRVAVRRLRVACKLFARLLDVPEFPVLRAELEAVADGLAPARDREVLLDRVAAAARRQGRDCAELLDHLGKSRDLAMRSAQDLLGGAPFQRLLFRLAGWIERDWPTAGAGATSGRGLSTFAADRLTRGRRKLVRAKNLMGRTDHQRHRLRIAGKNLRYAASFFAPLFDRNDRRDSRRAFMRTLSQLQDTLGELNDMAVASDRHDLFAELDLLTAARLEAELAAVLDAHRHRRGRLIKAAEKSLAKLAKTPVWWRSDDSK